MQALAARIKGWGRELGFQAVGIADADLSAAEPRLADWLEKGWHGEMDYMARHGALRARPAALIPGTMRVISCRMDYLTGSPEGMPEPTVAAIARYARGRDYHKRVRGRLQKLCDRIETEVGPFSYRVFCDSAPVMEVELAVRAGIGWRGKNTLLLSRDAGSYFFLGEIFTSLALPADASAGEHCGTCTACLDLCPTRAIRAPYQLDARRCISYLTIELQGAIPVELRPLIGNRVYGCDDCQACCPWNRFAQPSGEVDFAVRNGLDSAALVELFLWTEGESDLRLRGSAIRRIGYERWLRNLAVGLGNAPTSPRVLHSLRQRANHPSVLVREHVLWALARHEARQVDPGEAT